MKVSPQIRAGLPSDVPQLVPLVAQYWHFEGIPGFDVATLVPLLARIVPQRSVNERLRRALVSKRRPKPVRDRHCYQRQHNASKERHD